MKTPPKSSLFAASLKVDRREGVALVIVLAFVVILTGVIIAYFTRSLSNRQISNSSASQTKVSLLAQGVADDVIADLQEEIMLSSSTTSISVGGTTSTLYTPWLGAAKKGVIVAAMMPQISGTSTTYPGSPPNLLKRSAYGGPNGLDVPFLAADGDIGVTTPLPSNAINISSTIPSLNGRYVSAKRWNASYLLPAPAGATDTWDGTPDSNDFNAFTPPDWILVQRTPSQNHPPTTFQANMVNSGTNGSTVVGRYSYAIYDEGGLLDANVAGYPVGSSKPAVTGTTQFSYKPALTYADLTQIGLTQTQVDQLVAWRNYASAEVIGSPFQSPVAFSQSPTQNSGSNYYNATIVSNSSGFLTISSTSVNPGTGTLSITKPGETDRMFQSRQELIAFMQKGLGLTGTGLTTLNYLGTFSRGLNQPSFFPDPDRPPINNPYTNGGNNAQGYDKGSPSVIDPINPDFRQLVVHTAFNRNDGSVAAVGEPLVKKRFALSKLVWLTYLGPSGDTTNGRAAAVQLFSSPGAANPGVNNKDYDIWALIHIYGVSPAYLLQGTSANIAKYFGLTWQPDNLVPTTSSGRTSVASGDSFHDGEYKWFYNIHCEQSSQPYISGSAGSISRLADLTTASSAYAREPDFFELLKGAVIAGSKAKGSVYTTGTGVASIATSQYLPFDPYVFQTAVLDTNLDYAIMQLGANIIDQSKVDGYATRIVFQAGPPAGGGVTLAREFRGVENLPYMYRFQSGVLKLRTESPLATALTADAEDEPTVKFLDPGVGMVMEMPILWNPHDEMASPGYPGPTGSAPATGASNFRLIADSTDPNDLQAANSLTIPNSTKSAYTAFSLYGGDNGNTGSEHGQEISCANPPIGGAGGPGNPTTTDFGGTPFNTGPFNGTTVGGVPITFGQALITNSGNVLCPADAAMTFQVPSNTMFREPTIMGSPNVPQGSNLRISGSLGAFVQYAVISSTGNAMFNATVGGFSSTVANPLGVNPSPSSAYVCGIPVGVFPIEWNGTPVSTGTAAIHKSDDIGIYAVGGNGNPWATFRLQYKDPNPADTGNGTGWETYDEKYTQIDTTFLKPPFGTGGGSLSDQADTTQGGDWQSYMDPRTSRFAAINGRNLGGPYQTPGGSNEALEWSVSGSNEELTDRPDGNAGYAISVNRSVNKGGPAEWCDVVANGWTLTNAQSGSGNTRIGMFEQNNPGGQDNGVRFNKDSVTGIGSNGPMYYSDPDGVIRGGMGYYNYQQNQPAEGGIVWNILAAGYLLYPGLPLATAYPAAVSQTSLQQNGINQGQSRPYFLHRPFRSVAELGYVFSGTPWKNIDFFTPQSGDSGLLDIFTAYETPLTVNNQQPLVAGVVNLNTRQAPVLQALISGAGVDEATASGSNAFTAPGSPNTYVSFPPLNGQEAQALVTDGTNPLSARTSLDQLGQGQYENVSDLIGHYYAGLLVSSTNYYTGYYGPSADINSAYSSQQFKQAITPTQSSIAQYESMQNIQRFHEAFLRPLAAVANTRVWNLMIDLIAQTGRYPQGTSDPANFVVDGEQRYWVHVAIDRYTGKVLDKQIEVVKE